MELMFIPLHAHILFLLKFIVLNEIACFSNILIKYSIQHFFFYFRPVISESANSISKK